MDFLAGNLAEVTAIVGGVLFVADRIAKLTPTNTDNKVLRTINRIASIVGVRVPDNPGK